MCIKLQVQCSAWKRYSRHVSRYRVHASGETEDIHSLIRKRPGSGSKVWQALSWSPGRVAFLLLLDPKLLRPIFYLSLRNSLMQPLFWNLPWRTRLHSVGSPLGFPTHSLLIAVLAQCCPVALCPFPVPSDVYTYHRPGPVSLITASVAPE